MEKEKIRPLYSELQGYLAQAPEAKNIFDSIHCSHFWLQYNDCISLLNKTTGKDYGRFLIHPEKSDNQQVKVIIYRQKLGGLIACLHAEYFYDEPAPLNGMPHTVIHQTQQQGQSVFVQIIFDFQDKIEQNMMKYPEGSNERSFLQKIKGTLRNISDLNQLVLQIIKLSKEFGLSVEDLGKIFF